MGSNQYRIKDCFSFLKPWRQGTRLYCVSCREYWDLIYTENDADTHQDAQIFSNHEVNKKRNDLETINKVDKCVDKCKCCEHRHKAYHGIDGR